MPRASPFRSAKTGFVEHMKQEARLGETTQRQYTWSTVICHDIVREGGGPEDPVKISEEDLRYLLDHMTGGVGRRRLLWAAYSQFLKYCGNESVYKVTPRWPSEVRTRVDWLEPEQAGQIREAAFAMSPLHALIMHCELDLCLRRIEVQRLRLKDIHSDSISVCGKGRNGGKWRTVSLVPRESHETIARYLEYRRLRWGEAKPDDRLIPYKSPGSFDNRLEDVMEATGIRFIGNHTLRRTGGRLMWLAGVRIEVIASVMGHQSTEMTLRYIGVNLSDQTKAFEAVKNLRIQGQKMAKSVLFYESQ